MNNSNNSYSDDSTIGVADLQENKTALTQAFAELKHLLLTLDVQPDERQKILNYVQKIVSLEKGKLVLRALPHMNLDTGSYREVGNKLGYSKDQIIKWVKVLAPEVYEERRKGGVK